MATWDGSYQGDPLNENDYQYSNPENSTAGQPLQNHYGQSNSSYLNTDQSTDNPQNNGNSSKVYDSVNLSDSSKSSLVNNTHHDNVSLIDKHNKNVSGSNNIDVNVVNNSSLHPGANEFVPSGSTNLDTSKIFFADNKNRYGNRKYENNRSGGFNYRQHDGGYQRNQFKGNDKNRKNDVSKSTFYSNRDNHEVHHDYSDDIENREDESVNNIKDNSSKNSYKGRRARGHGRFQNDRYNTTNRHYNNTNNSSQIYPNTSSRPKNISTNYVQSSDDNDKQSRTKQRSKELPNEDPREETYRGNMSTRKNNYGDDDDGLKKDKKRRMRGKESAYSEDPRDERYRGRRDFYEDKTYRDKRTNYQEYNNYRGYERNSKSKNDDNKTNDESTNQSEDKTTNWRKKISTNKCDFDDAASQKERLTEQLNRGRLECLVCCDYIRPNDAIWSCNNCYHVLHLKCIKKWAESSQSETGWRCPACQNVNQIVPYDYFCFCGKTRDPEWNRRDVAHSCGEVCGRTRTKNNCIHKCTLLCHPGSCPLCTVMVTRYCGCGMMSQSLKCSTDIQLSCEATCGKMLNCQLHKCQRKCHQDECGSCEQTIHQECFCGKHNRDISCQPNTPTMYECNEICDKVLGCSNHKCKKNCHPGECGECPLKPQFITHCCCGQTPLTIERQNCLDPIPVCDKICAKGLGCGQRNEPHTCKFPCHPGDCPQCDLTTWVKCRCGNMDREISCSNITKAYVALCEKKCTKKRSCGKHKCNQHCCIDIEHICPLLCSKTLSCGKHKCELTCHKGRCQPCYRSSFEELYCECGVAVIYPPVACGTRRPTCSRTCSRQHSCGHEVLHNCHNEPNCPPCTILTQKWCYGKHELRKAVPCYFNDISCGMPCGMPLSCGRHKCISLCHAGSCKKPGQICTQPCTTPREMCGHNCAAPCHDGKCPDVPCKEMVKVTCICGNRSMTRACAENSREYQRIASGILASKMADMQLGHSVDLEEVFGQGAKKQNQLKTLECNEECKTVERNRKIALGLQIVNPDLSGKLLPRYTDYMKQWAKKDPNFCRMVHEKLSELVQLAKTSKQKSRSYSFDSMNRDKRHFIHEACEYYGCESQAYDQEPKRNVVATAVKDKCWLPSYSLLEMVQRENGQRKVPRPMLNIAKTNTLSSRISEILPSTAKKSQKLQPTTSSSRSPDPEIDYFDFPNSKWSYI
ncbi:hypothetical protein PV327_004363 [Microctonus hyperodae]|uniref:Protein shuttle craft n=1 Tax=Microctonus hyperodae TaxID=165561 RepID=A0AA39FC86_MICHY|nr:hypothetical protein PV327_004363 [Microctonus hyperodae]